MIISADPDVPQAAKAAASGRIADCRPPSPASAFDLKEVFVGVASDEVTSGAGNIFIFAPKTPDSRPRAEAEKKRSARGPLQPVGPS